MGKHLASPDARFGPSFVEALAGMLTGSLGRTERGTENL
jgi:hypothetical protein